MPQNLPPIPKLNLPLWALVQTVEQQSAPAQEPCDVPDAALVFTTVGRMMDFLQVRGAGEWRIRRILHHSQLAILMADLHGANVPGVCVNCEPDGSGGTLFTLSEVPGAVKT